MKDHDILRLFLEREGSWISGEAISQELGITRAAVWKHIRALQAAGGIFDSMPGQGYRMRICPDVIAPCLLDYERAPGVTMGRPVRCLDTVTSTNQAARDWANQGAPHGALVIANAQTQGRGRKGRAWVSTPGMGLWMSLVLRPDMPAAQVQPITLLAAVAASRAVEEMAGFIPLIKWPNDLWVKGRKLCGILTELSADMEGVNWVIIGTGVNMQLRAEDFPEELREKATSVFLETGIKYPRARLAEGICRWTEYYLSRWQSEGFGVIASVYRERMALLGQPIHMVDGPRTRDGIVIGVSERGELLLQRGDAVEAVSTGEVTVRPAEE